MLCVTTSASMAPLQASTKTDKATEHILAYVYTIDLFYFKPLQMSTAFKSASVLVDKVNRCPLKIILPIMKFVNSRVQ